MELGRIAAVTRNYEALQGLKLMPSALPVAVAGLGTLGVGDLTGTRGLVAFLASSAVAVALTVWLGRWYERHYGKVQPTKPQRRAWCAWFAAGLGAIAIGALLDWWLSPPVLLFGIAGAGVLAIYWRALVGFRLHHALAVTALVVASCLQLFGVAGETAFGITMLTYAAVYVCVGYLDHRGLKSILPPVQGAA